MKIYNTLTNKKEEFTPLLEDVVNIYVCGPTVYNLINIGNSRPMCVFDVLRRYLTYIGYNVNFIQNFTDIDDKIINSGADPDEFIAEYFTDAHGLNIEDATTAPRVTENIDCIIDLIQKIIDRGYAYTADDGVRFDIAKFKGYGKLSGRNEFDGDFALWKKSKPGEPFWQSPFGDGRPGWHIECSAMSHKFAGGTLDIHCGGRDLIFPHHENEIAQSEAGYGEEFCRYWMHNGFIDIDNEKMSKSLGNFKMVRDVAAEYGYETIRFMMLQAHYRSPINYTKEVLESCKNSLERLYNCRDFVTKNLNSDNNISDNHYDEYILKFKSAMDDDLNTANGLAVIFDLVRELNKAPSAKGLAVFNELTGVLGLLYNGDKKSDIPIEVKNLAEDRLTAKQNKNYSLADEIRNKIAELGYNIKDTKDGYEIAKK
ncbi:MAG: cysteine--tRNA ligase [Ruminococcus sp.]|jgi:cysteinyl-tRNA synthetase|nr:cysteine--tRNA ligase [Ruminococcus sp.]